MWISDLCRYPVKSLGGEALAESVVEPRGLAGDRRWMIVDARARFVTRREAPALARVDAVVSDAGLQLRHPDLGDCTATVPGEGADVVEATVWRDRVSVAIGNDEADAFLSTVLGKPVRLAHQFDASRRPVDPAFAEGDDHVSLADGFPLLLTTDGSLAALNAQLPSPVPMARFRPNLVIAGAEAWAEDRWRRIRIGEVVLRVTSPCSRCVVVTQQPRTGERLDGDEPLPTLRAMGRLVGRGVMFGQNAIPERLGTIRVGDAVEVLDEGDASV